METAPGEGSDQNGFCARGFYFLYITMEVLRELSGEVSGASGFSGLVVMAELDQNIGRTEIRVVFQFRQYLVPRAFGAVAAGAASVLCHVEAGGTRFQKSTEARSPTVARC